MNFGDIQEENDDSYNPEDTNNDMQFGAIPLGSIFSNMFGSNNSNEDNNSSDSGSTSKKKKLK